MNNKNDNFYSCLKGRGAQVPPASLDQKILMIAKKELKHSRKSFNWIIPTSVVTGCLIIFFTYSTYSNQQKNLNKYVLLNEAPEMILNYDKIELMADSSQLSDDDWKKVEGRK